MSAISGALSKIRTSQCLWTDCSLWVRRRTPIDKTERTFGQYIDYYTMRQAQEDGVTLEIVYEGRTHSAAVSDAAAMDAKF